MRGIVLVILLGITEALFAQTPTDKPPTLTASTSIALNALSSQRKQLLDAEQEWNKEVQAVDAEVRKSSPGWHISIATLQPEKDTAIPGTATTPLPATKPAVVPTPPKK